jgi:hypothetical protein
MLFAALLLAGIGAVHAQGADVGLINQVAGDVSYASDSGAGKVQAFMKMRMGDRFTLPAGAQVKVVYFQNGRQESWRGPAGFKSGSEQSEPLAGAAYEVVTLPVGVAQKIQKIPNLIQMAKMGGMQVREVAKLGGIQVRSAAAKQRPSPEQQAEVAAARTTYAQLRKQAAQDDITPEFYLFTVLQEYLLYDDMKSAADEMLRRQPGNIEAQQLAEWAGERAQASR